MEQTVIGSFWFLKVPTLQWNSHPCFLIYIYIYKYGTKTLKIANLHSHEDLFTIRNSLLGKKQTWLEWPHLARGCFWWSCFIIKSPVENYLFWVVPRVVLLFKFDCRINYIRKQWRAFCKYLLNPYSASVSLNWHSCSPL